MLSMGFSTMEPVLPHLAGPPAVSDCLAPPMLGGGGTPNSLGGDEPVLAFVPLMVNFGVKMEFPNEMTGAPTESTNPLFPAISVTCTECD